MKFIKREPDLGYLDANLWVPRSACNVEGVKNALTFLFNDKLEKTRYVQLYQERENHLVVPRAFWNVKDCDFQVVDCRPSNFPKVTIKSRITLDAKSPTKTTQRDAIEKAEGGVLQLRCGGGKSVIALEFAARMSVPTIIVVNNDNLMQQWREEIDRHLEVPGGIGKIQADVLDWKKPIVLSTYQTLSRRAEDFPEEVRAWFGLMIGDEGHHTAAPTFCRMADLFLGYRLLLTATPTRNDGAHVIYNFHVGPVLFNDLRQELTPKFQFLWTGLQLDMKSPFVKASVEDCNGELHLSKLSGFFGQWRPRLERILQEVRKHEASGRKTLVLSNSVAELVNLLAIYNKCEHLFTDIPVPDPAYFKSNLRPAELSKKARTRNELELKRYQASLYDKNMNATKREQIKHKYIPHVEQRLEQDDLAKKIKKRHALLQREYIKKLVAMRSTAGLMIAAVPADTRMEMLKTKSTIFTIYQYGLEGLDNANLDTVIACEPMTSKGAIQQFMGRILRKADWKKEPLVQFIEDDIGPIIGMCKKVRSELRAWPADEGGPYRFELVGHPTRTNPWNSSPTLGRSLRPVLPNT
jgi:hypothetical protein